MKRYLWTAVAVLFVNANASENPFALKENLLKIDSEQEMLLSELSKIAEGREDAELEADDDNMDAELEKEANAKEAPARKKKAEGKAPVGVDVELDAEDAEMDAELVEEAKKHGLPLVELEKEAPVKNEDSEEQNKLTNAIDEIVGDYDKDEGKQLAAALEGLEDNTQKEEPVSTAIVDEARKRAMADSAAKAKKDFEAALKIAQEKEAQEKVKLAENARETERLEVAAYEKQRAEKLSKQAEADAKVAETAKMLKEEQVSDIDVEAEKKAAKETADTGYKDAVKEMGGSEKIVTSKPVVEKTEMVEDEKAEEKSVEKVAVADGDIDPEAEKIAAKDAAEAAYLEAIKEMDQED